MIKEAQQINKAKKEITSIDEAISELEYLTVEYPEAAVQYVMNHKEEAIPKLLSFLQYGIDNYEKLSPDYFGHFHALFILSAFRVSAAFDLFIKIAELPGKWSEMLLGDVITEDLHRALASTYSGNLQAIKTIIENANANTWSRNAALNSLLALFNAKVLRRDDLVAYFKLLFKSPSFISDRDAMTHLVNVVSDLYPKELLSEVNEAFKKRQVNTNCITMNDVNEIISLGKTAALDKFIYRNPYLTLISNASDEMYRWCCFEEDDFRETGIENFNEDEDFFMPDMATLIQQIGGKIGRNEPCPCGSGKKYKKCCLN